MEREDDPRDLQRFVDAQNEVYAQATDELARGVKRTHWMWFIFPQLRGLGRSAMAERYGLASRTEALAYWEHPLLGPRLRQCIELVLAVEGRTARQIFGPSDDRKFLSSMTLFARVVPDESIFGRAIEKYFGGEADAVTIGLLDRRGPTRP